MRGIVTLAKKDFKLLVSSPTYYVVGFLCALIWSYSFLRAFLGFADRAGLPPQMLRNQPLNIHFSVFIQHISYINIIFLFAIPALTMRLNSEEKKMRTYDLLLTSPITATEIAVGKFLAGLGAALGLVLVSALYPFGTSLVAEFSWAPLWTSYLGLVALTALYVAVGLFASSLTESAMLSMIMGVILNLMLWFVSQGADFSDGETFTAVMEHLAVGQHFFSFLKGTLSVSSIVFFLSGVSLFVFLTQRVVESSRWR